MSKFEYESTVTKIVIMATTYTFACVKKWSMVMVAAVNFFGQKVNAWFQA